MSLAHALLNEGHSAAALRHAATAVTEDTERDGLLVQQQALILERLGRFDEALDGYRRALALVRRAGDEHAEAKLLCNRGVLHAYRGALRAAEGDLLAAEGLAERLDLRLMAATMRQNLAWLAARRGDLPGALASFDAAEPLIAAGGGTRHAVFELDRCQALLAAGLQQEAYASARLAVQRFEESAMATELAEARLALAEAALASGDCAAAAVASQRAAADFARQRRRGWAALAEHTAVRAAFAGGSCDGPLHARARRAAAALAAAGWPAAALDAQVLAARVALGLGRDGAAARTLEAVGRARRNGPVALRLGAWHAEALRRLAEGRRTSALRALRAGLAVLDEHRLSLGATELRAGAAVHGNALAALGLRLALESGHAAAVLEWAERGRAGALWQRPARPPDDAALAADLAELRSVLAAVDEAGKEDGGTRRLLRRQAELEGAIRQRARHAAGGGAEQLAPLRSAELHAALGQRALVEFVRQDGALAAVVVTGAGPRPRIVALGALGDVERELAALRFALRRLARGAGSAAARAVARANAEHAAAELDALLLAPLRERVGDRELVLIPTGELHAVPWAALASCTERALSVAPSAALWLRAARGRARAASGALVLAAGPGLPHAAAEVRALAERHPGAIELSPANARVGAVAGALEHAGRAHIASHGTFRADNPLFSALLLADGPLTVYDLERLGSTPRDMVLSACDGGVSAVRPGDELMGFSAALLALGTSALVASVVPVPDEPTHRLMLALHARLASGDEPAGALAGARADALGEGDADYVTAAGFVCFGAGSTAC
jgi:tetratricopeptide (TPR) repeat protein